MNISNVGWTAYWKKQFALCYGDEFIPARVIREQRNIYTLATANGSVLAEVSGQFSYHAKTKSEYPVIGDWVAIEGNIYNGQSIIKGVVPRRSKFMRRSAGTRNEEQVIAANMDIVFLVSGLDYDFNLRRIERYLTLAYESGAKPVIILNKSDLVEDIRVVVQQVRAIASCNVPVITVSAISKEGMEKFNNYLGPEITAAFLGSSGVGKSSLINTMLKQEKLKISNVRKSDSKGRHTTTHREIIKLSNGAILIDTPGMRELQLLAGDKALSCTFDDITQYESECRFNDCSHTREPDCAIQIALANGEIPIERYESYLQQQREIEYLRIKHDRYMRNKKKKRRLTHK